MNREESMTAHPSARSVLLVSKLGNLRRDRGLTQMELAQALGVHVRLIARWEAGDGKPNDENIAKLAELYGLTRGEVYEATLD